MRCPRCEFENPYGATTCGRCRAKLGDPADSSSPASPVAPAVPTSPVPPPAPPVEITCPQCQSVMPGQANFCGICGQALRGPVSEPQREAVPPTAPLPVAAAEPVGWVSDPTDLPETPEVANAEERSGQRPNLQEAAEQKERSGQRPNLQEPSPVEGTEIYPPGSLRPMVRIAGGWHTIGSPAEEGNADEHPQHRVQLSAFLIDRCAVSNAEYEEFDPDHRRLRPPVADGDRDPVVFVSNDDCRRYCRWRAQREGLPPDTYDLPTEAQWEAAARSGQNATYPWGETIDPARCNTLESGRSRTVAIDAGEPSACGLVLLGSNVREWCRDQYSNRYYLSPEAAGPDPAGPGFPGLMDVKVVRGASFQDKASELGRCAARNYAHPASSASDIGFRCVRVG